MKIKRLLSIILCLALLPTLFVLPALAEDRTLTLREDWRLTSDLDLTVPEGDTLTIDGNGHYIYELGGMLLNSGLGTVTFTEGTILFPAGDSGSCTTETSIALMAERQPHIVTICDIVRGTVVAHGTGTSSEGMATATKGETVTLDVTPEEGYALAYLTVIDGNGKEITVNGTSFGMPASTATVRAAFRSTGENAVTGITLNKSSVSMKPGETDTLTPSLLPENAADKAVIWSSSNDAVASVDDAGTVTAAAEGTAVITVTTADGGYTASCKVTVTRPSAPSSGPGGGPLRYGVEIKPSDNGTVKPSQTSAPKDAKITLTVTPDEGYALDKLTVTNSSGESVALTDNGDGTWTFTLPAMKVTVEATFVKEQSEPDPTSRTRFLDVDDNDWFCDAVYHCADNGIFQGTDENHFTPGGTMTRAMFATVLYRIAGEPAATAKNPFSDVKDGTWYTDAVLWAAGEKLVQGYGNGRFGPDDPVTREQMVTLFWRYKGQPAAEGGDLSLFADGDQISSWARDAFTWAVGAGVISGKGGGILDPQGTATRAEVAQIIMNYDTKVG